MIYAIQSLDRNRYVKFGRAKDPVRRMLEMQVSSPAKLRLLAVGYWPDAEEPRIHAYLSYWNVRGEWFRPCEAVDHMIALLVDPEGYSKWRSVVTDRISDTPVPKRLTRLFRIK